MRTKVLIFIELRLTLQQSETPYIVRIKVIHLQLFRIDQRPPQPLPGTAVMNEQAIGVMNLRALFPGRTGRVLSVKEHAGKRCQAKQCYVVTWKEHRFYF